MEEIKKALDRERTGKILCAQIARVTQEDIEDVKRADQRARIKNQINNGAIAILIDTIEMLGYDVEYAAPVAVGETEIVYFPHIAVPELGFEARRESRVKGVEVEPERNRL